MPNWQLRSGEQGRALIDRWSLDEDVEAPVLDEEFTDLAPVSKERRSRRKAQPRLVDEDTGGEREEDKRRRRRWVAPPHKRSTDYDSG